MSLQLQGPFETMVKGEKMPHCQVSPAGSSLYLWPETYSCFCSCVYYQEQLELFGVQLG